MTLNPQTRTVTRSLIAALAAASLVAACGSDEESADTTAAPAAASIAVTDAWARTSPMVATAGAVYLTITNTGGVDDALVAASVDPSVAETVEIHETVAVGPEDSTAMSAATGMAAETSAPGDMQAATTAGDGEEMMEMRPVDRIVAPADGSVALAPGGYHIMLIGLVQPLAVGSSLDVTLTFESSGDVAVTAVVSDTAP